MTSWRDYWNRAKQLWGQQASLLGMPLGKRASLFRREPENPNEPKTRLPLCLAMVALTQAKPIDAQALINFLQEHWKEVPCAMNISYEGDTLSFEINDAVVALTLIRMPIPWMDLERPCRTAWHWPEAGKYLRAHQAHFIATVSGANSDQVEAMLLLTRVIAATAATTDACGIYWGAGPVVNAPDTFIKAAQRTSRDYLPLYLWLAFHLESQPDGSVMLQTSGLRAFGLMELELLAPYEKASMLLDRAFNFAHYLLDNGPVLKNGDTIGLSDHELFRVQHVPSTFERSQTVYNIKL